MNVQASDGMTFEQTLKARYVLARKRTFGKSDKTPMPPKHHEVEDAEGFIDVVHPVVELPIVQSVRIVPKGFKTSLKLKVFFRGEYSAYAGDTETRSLRTMEQIAYTVLREYPSVSLKQVKGAARNRKVVLIRKLIVHRIRNESGRSFTEIGRWCGGRDHTTVMYLANAIDEEIKNGTLPASIDEWRRRYA
jgi:hypothetical protein